MTSAAFQRNLAFGHIAESAIARWLRNRGRLVLPVYDIEYETGKGQRVFAAGAAQFCAPDLMVFGGREPVQWIEAKHKTVFTWYRKKQQWQTGIDLNHWRDYLAVRAQTGVPVWILFLHRISKPDRRDIIAGCPDECPVGLFGQEIRRLEHTFDHTDWRHGRHGMVYWNHASLTQYANLGEVLDEPARTR